MNRDIEARLASMVKQTQLVKDEEYQCGHCAAFPCFRMVASGERGILKFVKEYPYSSKEKIRYWEQQAKQEASQPAGLCFQSVRRCAQECANYININDAAPADGGICKLTGKAVSYEDECHVPEMKQPRQ